LGRRIIKTQSLKIGFFSDAHGNVAGMSACIDYLKRHTEKLIFLGDAVGYLPDAVGVVDLLISGNIDSLMGNHDAMLLGLLELEPTRDAVYHIAESRASLNRNHHSWLSGNVPFKEMKVGEERILCVHGSPWNPLSGYIYPDSEFGMFGSLPYDAVFMGHTHHPFIQKIGDQLIVNVGSCGLPRDQGSLASCAIYDPSLNECEIIRIKFGADELVEHLRGKIHESVAQCFMRKSQSTVVGRIIEGNL
jgi:predicted phosphodiesterase